MSDDVLVPIRADRYGFDGLSYVANAIEEMRECNPTLRLAGSFLTMYQIGTNLAKFSPKALQTLGVPVMQTVIRASVKVTASEIRIEQGASIGQNYLESQVMVLVGNPKEITNVSIY